MKLEFLFNEKRWLSLNYLEISKYSNLHGRENRKLSNKKMKTVTTFPAVLGWGNQWGLKCTSTSVLVGRVHECNTTKSQYHQNYPQFPLLVIFPILVPCWHGGHCRKLVFTSEKRAELICASVYWSPPALCMAFPSLASFGRKCWWGFCKDQKLGADSHWQCCC